MKIKATYTRTFENRPLVMLDGGPFNGVELTPAALHALARLLDDISHVAERRPVKGRFWKPDSKEFEL